MPEQGRKKASGNPVFRMRMPPASAAQLHQLAEERTDGDAAKLIRELISEASGAAQPSRNSEEYWPLLILVAAILDKARAEGRSREEYICSIRSIYEMLLVRCISISGLDEQ